MARFAPSLSFKFALALLYEYIILGKNFVVLIIN